MATLFDLITVNDPDRLEKFINKLKKDGLEEKLLHYANKGYHYDVVNDSHNTNLPEDLAKDLDMILVNLK